MLSCKGDPFQVRINFRIRLFDQTIIPDVHLQMEQQPSFDPLAEPDMLAALTQAAPPPLNSWMSFDEPDASPFRQPLDASPAFDRSSRSLDTSQVMSMVCKALS